MGAIPWGDWIYHLPHRRDEVNRLHRAALDAQETILKDGITADVRVTNYKRMVSVNLLLMMTITEAHLNEEDYLKYRETVKALEEPANGALPAEIISYLAELGIGNYALKAMGRAGTAFVEALPPGVRKGIARVAKGIVKPEATMLDAAGRSGVSTSEDSGTRIDPESPGGTTRLPEGESAPPIGEETAEITEASVGREVEGKAAVEAMGRASISEWVGIGIGLAVAVGIDVICGAISGATERDQLDKEIDALQKATDKMTQGTTTLTTKIAQAEGQIVVEQKRLRDFVNGMVEIFGTRPDYPQPPRVGYGYQPEWYAYGLATTNHYLIFSDMKAKRHNYMLRNPKATQQQFLDWYLQGASTQITQEKLDAYAKLLVEVSKRAYSTDPQKPVAALGR
ncbi:hypothetical protein ACFVVX_10735 [Kitasatospora sp. NPDC058170]|uniref:hypothetical protein n=1 Tax=Kitasatospora sp. NPDC058170 TaxID=3346364 RepID=UPI0036DEA7C7